MRIAPKKWTHHHIQRLYHISMLATFVFINFVVIYGIFAVLIQADAGQQQSSVTITALVPEIDNGPTVVQPPPPGAAIVYNPYTVPAPKLSQPDAVLPQVTIDLPSNAPTKPVKLPDGSVASLPSYSTQNPTFQGSTGIKNAIIYLEIHSFTAIHATTYADANGNWSWEASESILPGFHTLFVTAQDPKNTDIVVKAQFDFYVEPAAQAKPTPGYNKNLISLPAIQEGNLFDVLVAIPEQFKTVAPGDDLVANIKLINFGSAGNPVDVGVQYTVENTAGEIIMQSSQTVAVATQLSILKTFKINPSLAEGQYKLTVRVPSKDVIATSADNFEVSGAAVIPLGPNTKVNFTVFFQALLAMLFLFSLVVYLEYNKVAVLTHFIKKVDEEDLYEYNE